MSTDGTQRHILVINSGSSSLKFAVINPSEGQEILRGLAERLGNADATLTLEREGRKTSIPMEENDHAAALRALPDILKDHPIDAVGHRVVHGGEHFSAPALIKEPVLEAIQACVNLAPLHNPANLQGIHAAREAFPDLPQVAVFDTAFHQTLPPHAYHYAIPYRFYEEHRIRRYGFHGTSHVYVGMEAAKQLDRTFEDVCLITAHLGNGCSACAIRNGESVDTTMGLTPLEGLVMGTRSGDVDPNLHGFLHARAGLSIEAIETLLNKESGLLGLSGISGDMRSLGNAAEAGNERAQLAIDLFCYRLAKAILGLTVALPRLDALVFTGGIGEHAAGIRSQTLSHLGLLGLSLDEKSNDSHGAARQGRVESVDSRAAILVVPTNEELMIARASAHCLSPTL